MEFINIEMATPSEADTFRGVLNKSELAYTQSGYGFSIKIVDPLQAYHLGRDYMLTVFNNFNKKFNGEK